MKTRLRALREPDVHGPLLTLAAALLTHLSIGTALELPSPVLALVAVAYTAFMARFRAALSSAALAITYAVYFFYMTGTLSAYSQQDALGLAGYSIAVFAIALMVGSLRRSAMASEQRLRESEGRMRGLMEAVPVGIAVISSQNAGRFEDFNPALWKVFGYESAEEFVEVPLTEHYYYTSDHEELRERVAAGSVKDFEVRFKRKDGTMFWGAVTSERQAAPAGTERTVLALRETTALRESEDARRRLEARNAATIESALDSIITIDGDGDILEFNPAAERTFGYSRDYALGKEMARLIVPPSLRERHRQGLQRYLSTGEPSILDQRIELDALRADGGEFPAEIAITRINYDGPPMFTGYVRDITERKQAEQALQRSEERYRHSVENAADAIFVHDLEGNIADVNQQACKGLGYLREELLDLNVSDIETYFSPDGVKELWKRLIDAGEPLTVEGLHQRKDGALFPVEVRVGVFESRGNSLMIALARDITERRRAERQLQEHAAEMERTNLELERKNEENEMFVYSVSHDLRSPLVNLEGFSQELSIVSKDLRSLIADSDLPPETKSRGLELLDEEMGESLHFIRNGVGRLSSIIDALLRLSRAGRVEYSWQAVDVESLVHRIVDSMRETVNSQGARIEVGRLPPAQGDSTSLEQVFANLLGNAVKYLHPERQGQVEVGGEPEPETGTVLYYVRDNGLGMTAHATDRVFKVFQRAHPEAAEGEGVGLTLVRRTVERHGGSVWVESTEGEGSTFFVRLREVSESEGD